MMFPTLFVCVAMLTVIPRTSKAVEYFLASRGQSCDSVCKEHNKICTETGHGFSEESAMPIFRNLGIPCKDGYWTDKYIFEDNPIYMKDRCDYFNLCVGFKNIPERINCPVVHNQQARRLCPCVKGLFVPVGYTPTLNGASSVVSFSIDDQLFLASSQQQANRELKSQTFIFRLNGNDFVLYQTVVTSYIGPSQIRYFNIDGDHFLAIPYTAAKHQARPATVIFKWDSSKFVRYQELAGGSVVSTTFFEVDSAKCLATLEFRFLRLYRWSNGRFRMIQKLSVGRAFISECHALKVVNGTYLACAIWGYHKKSLLFKWTGAKLVLHQQLPIRGYVRATGSIHIKNDTLVLFFAKRQHGLGSHMSSINSPVYRWNSEKEILEPFGLIPTKGASSCRPFNIGDDVYVLVAQSTDKKSVIFKYENKKFVKFQEIAAPFAMEATFFTHKRTHYIAVATRAMKNCPVFVWN